jgi:hypothetical protein
MKKNILLVLLLFGIIRFAISQDKTWQPHDIQTYGTEYEQVPPFLNFPDNPDIFQNINISQNASPQNEPSVYISRKDPNRVVAAWRDFRYGVDPVANRRVGYSYSTNGGTNWSVPQLLDSMLLTGLTRNSDPVVTCDTAGNFYIAVVAISNPSTTVSIGIYKSTDGGVTFPLAYIAAQGYSEDKEWVATDLNQGSPFQNTLYLSWTRFSGNTGINLTRSTNAGVNWTTPINVSEATSGVQGSHLCVSPGGQINVVWTQFSGSNSILKFDRSINGGVSFGTDVTISTGPVASGLPNNVNSFPSLAVDASGGPGNGWLYVVFCDNRNGDADVFFSRSTNNGVSWSAPFRINNDSIGSGKIQYWPWIAVNEIGKIAVLWYDTRSTTSNTIIEAYLARSTDGGNTFTNELISSQPSPTLIPGSNVRFGDYICLDYRGNRIVPVWTDERLGGYNEEIFTAVINDVVGIEPIASETPTEFVLEQNYPNPFNQSTMFNVQCSIAGDAEIKVFDLTGKELATVLNERLQPGTYVINYNASGLASGVYFYSLFVNGKLINTKKMIMIR